MPATSAAHRGKEAEKKVHDRLKEINLEVAAFDFERLPDARAAMGRLKAAVGDFEFFAPGVHGVLEVKETEHDFRIAKAKISQLPRLEKRRQAGGRVYVVTYHSTTKLWRRINVLHLPWIEKGSWDLREFPTYQSVEEALPTHLLIDPREDINNAR